MRAPAASSGGGLGASGRRDAQLGGEQAAALLPPQLGVGSRRLAEPVEELAEGVVVDARLLAHVEARHPEAEGGERPLRAGHPAVGDQRPAAGGERVADQPQLGQQLALVAVGAAGLGRQALLQPPPRVQQLLAHAGQLQPVGLLGVEPAVARLELGQRLEVGGERCLQLGGDGDDPDRGREVAAQRVDDRDRPPDPVLALQVEDRRGVLGADVGVAVAVAADPAAEAQRPRPRRQLEARLPQLAGELVEHVGDRGGGELVEVVDGVARLVDDVGAGDPDLVGLPEQVDRLFQPRQHLALGALVAARPVERVEQRGDLAQLGEHGAARRLGRVRGEDRARLQPGEHRLDLVPRQLGGGDPRHRPGQPAAVAAAAGGEVAPAVDLLGDVGEVEVGGEGARQPPRARRRGLAEQLPRPPPGPRGSAAAPARPARAAPRPPAGPGSVPAGCRGRGCRGAGQASAGRRAAGGSIRRPYGSVGPGGG